MIKKFTVISSITALLFSLLLIGCSMPANEANSKNSSGESELLSSFGAAGLSYRASTITVELENASIVSGKVEKKNSGYSGTGYANTDNKNGMYIEFPVNAASAGSFTFDFRYALSSGNRYGSIQVNGTTVVSKIDFNQTGSWKQWGNSAVKVALKAGTNTVRVTATQSGGLPNMDKVDITGDNGASSSSSSVSSEPSSSSSSSSTGPLPSDAKKLLKSLHNNSKFNRYVDNQIGNPVIMTTGPGKDITIDNPIVVPPGYTFDGHNKTVFPSSNMGGGSQDENQYPVFILCPGANLKNVIIGSPGVEGVHMMGDNELDNVHWPNVGEDAASVRSYFPGGKITITNGTAYDADDKVFQFNTSCVVTVKKFKAKNIGKLIRHMGSSKITITIEDVFCTGVRNEGVKSNTSNCTIYVHNFDVDGAERFDGPMKIINY